MGARRAAARAPAFPEALAALLRSRKIRVPAGLTKAPPVAYANQPASFVDTLAKQLSDDGLRVHAERVAGYAKRHEERVRTSWDLSPLIAEIRRRKLREPPRPTRVVGAGLRITRPFSEWSNEELLAAAREWSRRGRGS